jgi:hypothetical protein
MRHKLFFLCTFLAVLACVGLLVLFKLNLLPASVYRAAFFVNSSSGIVPPSLEKFEGSWSMQFTPTSDTLDPARCPQESGVASVHSGQFSGSLGQFTSEIRLLATVDENGALLGTTTFAGQTVGAITGQLRGEDGAGQLDYATDCKGTFTLHKLDSVVDPVAGKLISYSGDVHLWRNGADMKLVLGQSLYTGDRFDVPAGGSAYLSLGLDGTPVTVLGPATYTVAAQ